MEALKGLPGDWLAVSAMVLWGFWAFFVKLALRDASSEPVLLLSYVVATFAILIYAVNGADDLFATVDNTVLKYTVTGGLFAGLGSVGYYLAIDAGAVAIAATITGMYFVVSTLLGVVILNEKISWRGIFGIVCAVLAVIML
ncbi:MAG: EamA family transporter, partial [Halobacteria archaeon]